MLLARRPPPTLLAITLSPPNITNSSKVPEGMPSRALPTSLALKPAVPVRDLVGVVAGCGRGSPAAQDLAHAWLEERIDGSLQIISPFTCKCHHDMSRRACDPTSWCPAKPERLCQVQCSESRSASAAQAPVAVEGLARGLPQPTCSNSASNA